MIIISLTIICIALVASNVYFEIMHIKERAKLLDRIQAKDLSEYKALNAETKKELIKPVNKEIDFI